MSVHDLPPINASLNALSAVFLLMGWWFITHNRKLQHITMMSCALITSTVFLVCYLVYHFNVTAVTRFTGQGMIRPVYFALLISHVLLAFVILPLVFLTIVPALRARFDRHRRIARWTLPIWLYVSVTGVLVYLMLYQWFPGGG
ncbi:MAG: DUF420 domain-containing protein [Verrucomicrobiota bacterium]